ncbi:chorion peroxidase-like [Babylonia areolata]|uniref:chorion peroxidase-like n=1 Tax=Babylonia areolata TaxID=304850 RepID=UPI003FD2B659
MSRLLLLLLPLASVTRLTAGVSRCPRSTSTTFAATHHHHPQGSSDLRLRGTRDTLTCNSTYLYRLADGTCNNFNNPSWGAVGQTYLRLLAPVYDDGVEVPRLKQVDGASLPSPRDVSTKVHDFDFNRYHPVGSVMLMEWGQFLAHDIVATSLDDGDLTGDCCHDDLVTGTALHPDVETGGPCFPIIISEGDRYFTNVSTRCMEFVRSNPVNDASGVRQQMNQLSSYIDGTNVYGASEEAMRNLRTLSGGKLAVKNEEFLPESTENYCIKTNTDDYCFEAGDSRVNVYPGLGALHTLFLRYHNYVAEQLAANHADYDDEKLFQETRKIVIAVMQRITYSEYLPVILGSTAMTTYGLKDTWTYNDSCDASLTNVFVAAAFRFGHSMVPDSLKVAGSDHNSVDLYLRPYHVLSNLDSLVEGLVTEKAEKADRWYSEGITDQLFEDSAQDGFDIASLNIQRGRDHGLPSYNAWREFCGLDKYTAFDQMSSSRAYQNAYQNVDDVDLYSGALSEGGQGTVGDTYKCLLGKQFQSLRNCDRFWWETEDTSIGFADERTRRQIQRIRLSHVICLTTGITEIQTSAMKVVGSK